MEGRGRRNNGRERGGGGNKDERVKKIQVGEMKIRNDDV